MSKKKPDTRPVFSRIQMEREQAHETKACKALESATQSIIQPVVREWVE